MTHETRLGHARERRRIRRGHMFIGAVLVSVFAYQWQLEATDGGAPPAAAAGPAAVAAATVSRPTPPIVRGAADRSAFEALLRRDPLGAIEHAREHHRRAVRDYSCVFTKQELLPGGLSDEQDITVKFQQSPFAIMMHWTRNPGPAERVIYVAGRWINPEASDPAERDLAICQPGAIARIFVKSVREPIRGDRARKQSRRYIDDFGFLKALDLMVEFTRLARDRGELKISYEGPSTFDGRPTYVLNRTLPPFTGPNSLYPDGAAEYHLDQEWLVPVAVYSFADASRKTLLGKYEYRGIRMNVGCTAADFDPSTYGM